MPLDLQDCTFFGPALPEPFVRFDLESLLQKARLLPRTVGAEGKELQARWETLRNRLRALGDQGGSLRVAHHVLEPLREHLGYAEMSREPTVATREGEEDGGFLLKTADGKASLRAWAVSVDTDLDAPNRRGRAYRFSPTRVAQRVLLAKGERFGLLTDGLELRLLVSDPARPDSQISIRLDRTNGWRGARSIPDSYRLVLALGSPAGVAKLPDLTEAARLSQTKVTEKLREQARLAVEGFVQEVLDHPGNTEALASWKDRAALARALWEEGLVLIYRLLFTFKLESSPDPARAFSFASTSLWRKTYSPNTALAQHARKILDEGLETGQLLEEGLRALFRLFERGLSSSELKVSPLSGMLFGEEGMPLLNRLRWGERAVALLLDRLLWTPGGGRAERARVHYGPLDVEDLGRVYEALLELEPGIASEKMCRLRRDKLEVVLPIAQKPAAAKDEEASGTVVEWVEDIRPGQFFLRVGLGRKATGSYYTPHPFVRFLVQETLAPEVAHRCPTEDPQPAEILKLNVLDPAMGSGHFLVEACRFLADRLYEACRLCDDLASAALEQAERTTVEAERSRLQQRAAELWARVEALPDPNDELMAYLPSRATESIESGLSQSRALALCRRLVAVNCLYGVDKNQLAVELAKLSLWLESYSEGLPLTFLDHRLICGDSMTGPRFKDLLSTPGKGEQGGGLFIQQLVPRLQEALNEALAHIHDLEATIGKDVADLERKHSAKKRLDQALAPFKLLARAWAGGAMLGPEQSDDRAYEELLKAITERRDASAVIASRPGLARMLEAGKGAFSYELELPEVFYPKGTTQQRHGFDAVIGNPPWDALQPLAKEFFAAFDLSILDAPTRLERSVIEDRLTTNPEVEHAYNQYINQFDRAKNLINRCYSYVNLEAQGRPSGAAVDIWQVFAERGLQLVRDGGLVGFVLPSAFHANQSATGIRDLYLHHAALQCCFSFENRDKLFEIDSRFKFAAIVARRSEGGTTEFPCAFYLHDLQWLFEEHEPLRYTISFIEKTGGEYLSFLELRSPIDAEIAKACFKLTEAFGAALAHARIRLGRELHMTDDSYRFTPANTILEHGEDVWLPQTASHLLAQRHFLVLHEGKTFHQYSDHWERPRYLVATSKIADRSSWLQGSRYYRLAFRRIARSTDERTAICCMLPPGMVLGDSAHGERQPESRPSARALWFSALVNSFPFDWNVRSKSAANLSLFILESCPFPRHGTVAPIARVLAHGTLRLTANHEGYRALWDEQLGSTWREKDRLPFAWPVLPDEDSRWAMRATIDALVADAYGLSRDQYRHVLSSFSHTSYPAAPERCLAAFDELKSLGAEAFTRKYDPYWDIPLVEQLPKPVIHFPGLTDDVFSESAASYEEAAEPAPLPMAADEPAPAPAPKRSRKKASSKPRS
jgi:hypothetical protein